MCISIKLTVFFEQPFWVGVFEKKDDNTLSACRIVFGSEPKDYDVYEFLLKEYYNLKFSSPLPNDEVQKCLINRKRLNKNIKKEIENIGIGTKSQLAMKQQYEENKTERRKISREKMKREKERQYLLKQEKKKKKHKGH